MHIHTFPYNVTLVAQIGKRWVCFERPRETEARLWEFGIIMTKVNICLVFIERMNRVVHCRLDRNLGSRRTRREMGRGRRESETGEVFYDTWILNVTLMMKMG